MRGEDFWRHEWLKLPIFHINGRVLENDQGKFENREYEPYSSVSDENDLTTLL